MIKQHIINIGFPRTGTTWLWNCLNLGPKDDKENNILTTSLDFDHYVNYYSQHEVSANFNTNLWCMDTEIIRFVQQHATHISFIVRNPFDFVENYFNYIHQGQDTATLINFIVTSGYIKYRDIVDRWSGGKAKFKVFFFEDLQLNPTKFFEDYIKFCQVPVMKNKNINYNLKVNANLKQEKIKIDLCADHIDLINQEIDRFQLVIDRDLTHWKR